MYAVWRFVRYIVFNLHFQFPTLWDEDCNVFKKSYHLPGKILSVPYTLGWRLQFHDENGWTVAHEHFQFPTLWDEDCNLKTRRYSCYVIFIFQFPTLWDEDCNEVKTWEGIIQELDFQFPTLWDEDCNYVIQEVELTQESLSVPYTLGWRLQFGIRTMWPKVSKPFSSLHFGMKTAI